MRILVAVAAAALLAGCTSSPEPDARPEPPRVPGSSTPAVPPTSAVAHRAVHTLTTLRDGTHLVVGGCDVDGCSRATASAYLLGPDGVARTGELVQARDGHTATRLRDGRVLVVGGYSGEGEPPLTSAEVYDPATGEWERVGDLTAGRGGHATALLGDGRVLVAGGWVGTSRSTATTEIFDPATGRFEAGPNLPEPVDGLAATTLADGGVLLTGGLTGSGGGTRAAYRIDARGILRAAGSMHTGRFKHALVTLPSGEALAIGGTPDDRQLLRSTELYDPGTDRFRPGPDLAEGRYKLAGGVALLPDGRVVVAGGGPGIEVVDVARDESTPIRAAGETWGSFSTVGVGGGELVVLGGYDREIRLTATHVTVPLSDL